MSVSAKDIICYFQSRIPFNWKPKDNVVSILEDIVSKYQDQNFRCSMDESFIEAVNQKLDLNKESYQNILDAAFADHVVLNYNYKVVVRQCLDLANYRQFEIFLEDNGIVSDKMMQAFKPVSPNQTLKSLISELNDPKKEDIVATIFSRFCFNLFQREFIYEYFSGTGCNNSSYLDFLYSLYPDLKQRDCGLYCISVDDSLFEKGYVSGCNRILGTIYKAYYKLDNHCDLSIVIPPLVIDGEDVQWKLYSDIVLFSEKFITHPIEKVYFRWKKVKEETCDYIKSIDEEKARFDLASEGFVFRDCFIVRVGQSADYYLHIVLEKNVRDERLMYCPACRSDNVQGNSYPILNVKSWECNNPLCPDRSKYNRGKRYSFVSLLRQDHISDYNNKIPKGMIAKWHLDSVSIDNLDELYDMILMHYSYYGDIVVEVSATGSNFGNFGRIIKSDSFEIDDLNYLENFYNSPYFNRFLVRKSRSNGSYNYVINDDNTKLIHGDSFEVLCDLPDNYIDGMVTSPPYYNAKSYSQWPNIYCYLYDMYNIICEAYRVLKPGSVFLFNIFDYFDNEKNIVFSDMGKKRMILGAYLINIFQKAGFLVHGNIVWDKGEIQGNRSFNQGNETPYYQSPLNCWEHVLIFTKGPIDPRFSNIVSDVKKIKPVIKMIKGKNVYGHEAPYPEEIPALLLDSMSSGDTVLDPFSGSMTTGLVAYGRGVSSYSIEKSEEYCELSTSRFKAYSLQKKLI